MDLLRWLKSILWDQCGEIDPTGGDGAGQGGSPGDSGQGGAPGDDDGAGAGDGQGQAGGAPPVSAYGEFGDEPQTIEEARALAKKIYDAHNGIKPEFETLKGKTAATERNLAALRKTLESSGVRAVPGEDGQIRLEVIDREPPKRKTRFQDTHKQLFEQPVLEAIECLVQDRFEELLETRERTSKEQQTRAKAWVSMKNEANDLMIGYFPQLEPKFDAAGKPTNTDFNEAFYNRATEIWTERYRNNPQGELIAALQAARELNLIPQAVKKAEIDGFNKGKENKKILGPVGSGSGAGKPAGGTLSKDEYLKLSPDEKAVYDKKQMESKK